MPSFLWTKSGATLSVHVEDHGLIPEGYWQAPQNILASFNVVTTRLPILEPVYNPNQHVATRPECEIQVAVAAI